MQEYAYPGFGDCMTDNFESSLKSVGEWTAFTDLKDVGVNLSTPPGTEKKTPTTNLKIGVTYLSHTTLSPLLTGVSHSSPSPQSNIGDAYVRTFAWSEF